MSQLATLIEKRLKTACNFRRPTPSDVRQAVEEALAGLDNEIARCGKS